MKKIDLKKPTKIKVEHVIISIILCIIGEIAIIYLFITRPDIIIESGRKRYTLLLPFIMPLIPYIIWSQYKK